MIEYQCNRCTKIFSRKADYDKHRMRKKPCSFKKNVGIIPNIHACKCCKKKFNRKDSYDRHIKSCTKHINILKDNNEISNSQFVVGNNNNNNCNNIVIKYNLFPFAKDGIDCLSTSEKIAIFTSEQNPYEMIIIKVNLDPLKINHHNIGIPDLHRGYGMIYNGNEWITEKISVILEILLNSKEKDLLKIHNEIKDFLSEDINKEIKNKMDDLNNTLNPRNPIEIKAKNILTTHLKKYFYNNRNLALDAQKYMHPGKVSIHENKNEYKNIFKDGLTFEDLDMRLQSRKHMININKEICEDLLQKSIQKKTINHANLKLIRERIRIADDVYTLGRMIDPLFQSAYLGHFLTDKIIDNKIMKNYEMLNFRF